MAISIKSGVDIDQFTYDRDVCGRLEYSDLELGKQYLFRSYNVEKVAGLNFPYYHEDTVTLESVKKVSLFGKFLVRSGITLSTIAVDKNTEDSRPKEQMVYAIFNFDQAGFLHAPWDIYDDGAPTNHQDIMYDAYLIAADADNKQPKDKFFNQETVN